MSWFGRVSQNVAELRIHFCPRSAESAGVRFVYSFSNVKNPNIDFRLKRISPYRVQSLPYLESQMPFYGKRC